MYGQVSFGKSNPSCRLRLGIGKVKLGKKPVRLKLALSGLFMFLQPVQCSLYFLYSQEKERKIKRNSFLFFPFHCSKFPSVNLFTPYQWRKGNRGGSCPAEEKNLSFVLFDNHQLSSSEALVGVPKLYPGARG